MYLIPCCVYLSVCACININIKLSENKRTNEKKDTHTPYGKKKIIQANSNSKKRTHSHKFKKSAKKNGINEKSIVDSKYYIIMKISLCAKWKKRRHRTSGGERTRKREKWRHTERKRKWNVSEMEEESEHKWVSEKNASKILRIYIITR